jgi:hypothetical protein
MAWYSYTAAIAIPPAELGSDRDPKIIAGSRLGKNRYVFTHSRNGAIFGTLKDICIHSPIGTNLYLLNDSALLEGNDIVSAANNIQDLLTCIENDPGIVLEATKVRHQTTSEIYADGFEPLGVKIVYPDSAIIKGGWVYFYDRDEVHSLLRRATSSSDPCPSYDDEGEGLEYVFGLLKSHLSLLRFATESGFIFVFAEMN